MKYEYKQKDTETWILSFLYRNGSSTVREMAKEGCQIMTFSIDYEQFLEILRNMEEKELIMDDTPMQSEVDSQPFGFEVDSQSSLNKYDIDGQGIFQIKREMLNPITKLDSDELKYLKTNFPPISSDKNIINDLLGTSDEKAKESIITNYALRYLPYVLQLVSNAIRKLNELDMK